MASRTGVYELTADGGRLYIRVSPGAKSNEISGLWTGADGERRLALKVAAPPDKGKANAAAVKLLASALGLPKSALMVASGDTSRLKTIVIEWDRAALAGALDTLTGER